MSFLFQAGGALPATHPMYAVRQEADDTALMAAINGQILHVSAPRQVGKTSLLKRLKYRLTQEGWYCTYIDLSVLMNLTKSDWYAELGKLLASELSPEYIPTLQNHIELRHYLTTQVFAYNQAAHHVAIFFDEIESILKTQDDFSSDAFFMTIRNIYNERDTYKGQLVIALAGAISPGNLVKDLSISPFNVGQKIDLGDFTLEESKQLTDHLSDLGLPVEETVHQTIYAWTSGHPYLTHSICFELEKQARIHNLIHITPKSVIDVINHIFLSPVHQDSNIWHITKILKSLTGPAQQLSLRLQREKVLLMEEIDTDTYLDLYLTGAFKATSNNIVIRNRIYEKVFLKEESHDKSSEAEKAIRIAYIYCDADLHLMQQFWQYLEVLRHQQLITEWHRGLITPGDHLQLKQEHELKRAELIFIGFSASFIASAYYEQALQAFKLCHDGKVTLVPLLLGPIGNWQQTPFSEISPLPRESKTLSELSSRERDKELSKIADDIHQLIKRLQR